MVLPSMRPLLLGGVRVVTGLAGVCCPWLGLAGPGLVCSWSGSPWGAFVMLVCARDPDPDHDRDPRGGGDTKCDDDTRMYD